MAQYNIAFYYSPEDKAYVTCVPELPGCMSDGKTIDEAIRNTMQVINEWIDVARELGRSIPSPLEFIDNTCANSSDIASYILQRTGKITTWALEKLTYYCMVWSLVWYGNSVVSDVPQAWKDGPVFPELYAKHKRKYLISPGDIPNSHKLSESEQQFINLVLDVYGLFDAEELRDMTHREDPWNIARGDTPVNVSSTNEITDQMIIDYYKRI